MFQSWPREVYLLVMPRSAAEVGNYVLTLEFVDYQASFPTLTVPNDLLHEGRAQAEYSLYVARSQFFQFALSAGALFEYQEGYIHMQVFDEMGADVLALGPGPMREIYTLAASSGDAVSAHALFLLPGRYRVRFTAVGLGGPPPAMTYRLCGLNQTDPIGPVLGDSLLRPRYLCSEDPAQYCYPGAIISPIPYLLAVQQN